MKTRTILVSLAMSCAGLALCLAADMNMGTWKLNEAKSKLAPGATKNHTVVYAPLGDGVKITVDGVSGDGKPTHSEWAGKYDGRDYPVTGDPGSDARSYKEVNDRTLDFAVQEGGQDPPHGSRCRVGRRQEPHGHHDRDRFERQEGHEHLVVR